MGPRSGSWDPTAGFLYLFGRLADGEIMKENLAVLVALLGLILPRARDGATPRRAAVKAWDGTGMPPDERYADWS